MSEEGGTKLQKRPVQQISPQMSPQQQPQMSPQQYQQPQQQYQQPQQRMEIKQIPDKKISVLLVFHGMIKMLKIV